MEDSKNILIFDTLGTTVMGCKDQGVSKIVIPEGIRTIGGAAFQGCTGLTSIEIPNSVTKIEWSAFRG